MAGRSFRGRTPIQRVHDHDLQKQAWELRRSGLTLTEIAERMGRSSKSGINRLLANYMARDLAEDVGTWRALQMDRLDRAIQGLVAAGAFDGDPVLVRELRGLIAEQCKIAGLYAPAKVQVSGQAMLLHVTPQEALAGLSPSELVAVLSQPATSLPEGPKATPPPDDAPPDGETKH